MDIIINDPGIAAAATETQVKAAIGAGGVNLGSFATANFADADQQSIIKVFNSTTLSGIQNGVCAQLNNVIPNNCVASDLATLNNKVQAALAAPQQIGSALGYAESDIIGITTQTGESAQKSNTMDGNFATVTGSTASGIVAQDMAAFNAHTVARSAFTSTLENIGKVVMNSTSFTLSTSNIPTVQTQVNTLVNTAATDTTNAISAMTTLGMPAVEISNPSAAAVTAELNLLSVAFQNVTTALKFTSSNFANKKLALVAPTLAVKMSQHVQYHKAMSMVREGCKSYLLSDYGGGATLLYNLAVACNTFVGAVGKSSVLKDVCLNISDLTTAFSLIFPGTPAVFQSTLIIKKGCEVLMTGTVYKADGSALIPLTAYATVGATIASWAAFQGAPSDFFNDISNSDMAWGSLI